MMKKSMKMSLAVACLVGESAAIKFRPPEGSVPWHEEAKKPEFTHPEDHDIDYFVPNFGEDNEITTSKKNMAKAEEDLKHKMFATFEPKKNPWDDYTVPHFGEDQDIKDSKHNLYAAEKQFNHELMASFDPPDDPPRNYFVPHFGEDSDILTSKANTAKEEAVLGHAWNPTKDEDGEWELPKFSEFKL